MFDLPDYNTAREELLALLRQLSVFTGDFTLASGAKSNYYIDCRLTTLHSKGAWMVGNVMRHLIFHELAQRHTTIKSVGGLTMGADPISLAISLSSYLHDPATAVSSFVVRKAPKAHGQTKLIEGEFKPGDRVVVIDDVITTGESTIKAIDAVVQAGGIVEFAAVLVDREQGGRQNIEARGHRTIAAFTKSELLPQLATL
jgi:orotate phosphoribosyltransferase